MVIDGVGKYENDDEQKTAEVSGQDNFPVVIKASHFNLPCFQSQDDSCHLYQRLVAIEHTHSDLAGFRGANVDKELCFNFPHLKYNIYIYIILTDVE